MSKDLVQAQFGANAANYVASPVHAKGKSLDRLIELVAPSADWHVLDIATATGHTALAFAPHVAHVIASDITPEMLGEARSLAAQRGVTNIDFSIADAEQLPFQDAVFDLVTCRIAPHHFPDVAAFVAETARVLKPGGAFALVDNLAPDRSTSPDRTEAELDAAAAFYNAFEKRRDPSHGRALTQAEWLELIAGAGFDIAALEHIEKEMSFQRWCTTMSVPADVITELRQTLQHVEGAIAAFLQPRSSADNDDITFTLTEIIVVARKT